jgi:hypothetical protein
MLPFASDLRQTAEKDKQKGDPRERTKSTRGLHLADSINLLHPRGSFSREIYTITLILIADSDRRSPRIVCNNTQRKSEWSAERKYDGFIPSAILQGLSRPEIRR